MKLIQAVKNSKPEVTNSKESVEFRIGDAGKIIDILRSKMYSNPIQTLVQEYLCNARDAVREVKGSKIVVSLNDAAFKVRDFGPGISRDRMLNTFVQYGNTTKDGSNNQTGGFGLGSKLGWAYSDRFDIVTFIDGVKTHYIASIGSNKNGTLDLISEESTTEANGTEIVVPLIEDSGDFRDFHAAIVRATALWDTAELPEVILDNDTVDCANLYDTLELTDTVTLYSKKELEEVFGDHNLESQMILSIDGIGYPVSKAFTNDIKSVAELDEALSHGAVAVFHIGNGQVEVAASRESINENERVVSTMTRKAKDATKALKAWTDAKLAEAKSLAEFAEIMKDCAKYASLREAKFTDTDSEEFSLKFDSWYANDKLAINSTNLDKLSTAHYLSDGSKKRRSSWDKGIYADYLLIVADESISQARQTMKVTQAMRNEFKSSAILISQGESSMEFAKSLVNRLGALLLSEVTLPKVERAEANRTPEGFVKVQLFVEKSYSSKKSTVEREIQLETNDKKFVYVKNEDRQDLERYESMRDYLKDSGFSLCIMGAKGIKAVEGNSFFISLESFLKDPTSFVSKKLYNELIKDAKAVWVSGVSDKLESLSKNAELLAMLKDVKLANDLKTLADNEGDTYRAYVKQSNDLLMEHIVSTNKKVAELKALSDSFPEYVKANYPLIKYIDQHDDTEYGDDGKRVPNPFTEASYLTEIVAYLNGKAK